MKLKITISEAEAKSIIAAHFNEKHDKADADIVRPDYIYDADINIVNTNSCSLNNVTVAQENKIKLIKTIRDYQLWLMEKGVIPDIRHENQQQHYLKTGLAEDKAWIEKYFNLNQ